MHREIKNEGYRVTLMYRTRHGQEDLLLAWPEVDCPPFATRDEAMACWDAERARPGAARPIAAGVTRLVVLAEEDLRASLAAARELAVTR